jgi:hypothetical protein
MTTDYPALRRNTPRRGQHCHPERMMWPGPPATSVLLDSDSEAGSEPMDDDFKRGFWLKLVGGLLVGGILLFLFLILFTRAIYAWGSLIAFGVLVAVVLLAFWIHDRRAIRRYEETS